MAGCAKTRNPAPARTLRPPYQFPSMALGRVAERGVQYLPRVFQAMPPDYSEGLGLCLTAIQLLRTLYQPFDLSCPFLAYIRGLAKGRELGTIGYIFKARFLSKARAYSSASFFVAKRFTEKWRIVFPLALMNHCGCQPPSRSGSESTATRTFPIRFQIIAGKPSMPRLNFLKENIKPQGLG